jgi:hypothetical protein
MRFMFITRQYVNNAYANTAKNITNPIAPIIPNTINGTEC